MERFIVTFLVILVLMCWSSHKQKSSAQKNRNAETQSNSGPTPVSSTSPAAPYQLKTNELPQGTYLIGRDIPAGTYDFFVVYGDGGKFDICKRDESGNIIDGTWTFYWVGLKEPHEKRELIHVLCEEGYTIKIKGSVILRIAKSQNVKINL